MDTNRKLRFYADLIEKHLDDDDNWEAESAARDARDFAEEEDEELAAKLFDKICDALPFEEEKARRYLASVKDALEDDSRDAQAEAAAELAKLLVEGVAELGRALGPKLRSAGQALAGTFPKRRVAR